MSDGTPATRPVISSAPANVTYGQAFTVKTTSAATIAKVTWIRLSAVTHSFNQSQRMNVLSFTKGTDQITVTAPANAQPGPAGALHAVHRELERRAVGGQDHPDYLTSSASLTAASPQRKRNPRSLS